MAVELAKLNLEHLTEIQVTETPRIAWHSVPGMKGNIAQTIGRDSVSIHFRGILYGDKIDEELSQIRKAFANNEPVDFFTEAVGQGYFAQVLITRFIIRQRAGYLDIYDYECSVTEYVAPPAPTTAPAGMAALNADLQKAAGAAITDVQNATAAVSKISDMVANLPTSLPIFDLPTDNLKKIGAPYEAIVGNQDTLKTLTDLGNLFKSDG